MCKTTFGTPTESTRTTHVRFKPSSCVKILRIDSHGMCRASTRAWMVRCQTSLKAAAKVWTLVTVTTVGGTPPRGSNSAASRPPTKALCHHRIIKSLNVSFPNVCFNNAVVLLGVFFKSTQNLITQHCSTDTSSFSKYSATHCLSIHECSASYARFFFFLRVHCCTHLLLRSRAFYPTRKLFFPLSTLTIVHCRGMSTCF